MFPKTEKVIEILISTHIGHLCEDHEFPKKSTTESFKILAPLY